MAVSPGTQVLKLAIGLASVVAVAGIAGQLARADQVQDRTAAAGGAPGSLAPAQSEAPAFSDGSTRPGRRQRQGSALVPPAQDDFGEGGGSGFFAPPQRTPSLQGGRTRTHFSR